MQLLIDIGNTNTVLGIYQDGIKIHNWRIRTDVGRTADELGALLGRLFETAGIRTGQIRKSIISSVVPPVMAAFDAVCRKHLGHAPHWIDPRVYAGMPNLYANPAEVGADRIVNAVAAYAKYKTGLIVIDFGTATTFDVISPKGQYLGGAISPGILISAEALFLKASKLPRVELFKPPACAIGKDTVASIQSGVIFGYAAMVDGMVTRMQDELGEKAKVIATGGLAPLMQDVTRSIEAVEPDLTLEGLWRIAQEVP